MFLAKKTYYTDYAIHAWRYFLSNPDVEKIMKITTKPCIIANWNACKVVYDKLNEIEREFIQTAYLEKDTIPDNVFALSKRTGSDQNVIWRVLRDCEAKFARERGLI